MGSKSNRNKDTFVTVENLKHCESAFRAYMQDKHAVILVQDDVHVRRTLYNVMVELRDRHGNDTSLGLKDINNLALNIARDIVLRDRAAGANEGNHQQNQQTNQKHPGGGGLLERDKQVFGDRAMPPPSMVSVPAYSGGGREAVSKAFDALVDQRGDNGSANAPQWNDVARPSQQVDPMEGDEFQRRLADMEHERDAQWAASVEMLPPPPGATDPQALVRSAMQEQDDFKTQAAQAVAEMRIMESRANDLIAAPPASQRVTLEHCIALCGADRDVTVNPYRYNYVVHAAGYEASGLQHAYRNVEWISATSVVLPMEIIQPSTATPKPFFSNEFSFAYPYVLLAIEGFDGVYDGTNEAVRRSFCMMVFHRSYKAPNGRGYVLLQPAQTERKLFRTPLASLRDLNISLLKPNGTLINNSVDSTKVALLQYETQNRLYVKIICSTYFDRNEFYPGDMVAIRGFVSAPPTAPAADSSWDAQQFRALDAFVNRREGHEVVQLGQPNDQGFYKTFYVLAPGVLDQGVGRVLVDDRIIAAIALLNSAATPANVVTRGVLVNSSLQNVVTMKLGMQSNDAPSLLPLSI